MLSPGPGHGWPRRALLAIAANDYCARQPEVNRGRDCRPARGVEEWRIRPLNRTHFVIDTDGFRPNVGIVIANADGRVLWARRVGQKNAWQFPHGGIPVSEQPVEALCRVLYDDVGIAPDH